MGWKRKIKNEKLKVKNFEMENLDYSQILEAGKRARREEIEQNFDLQEELMDFVQRYMPEGFGIREEFLAGIKNEDLETFQKLIHELEVKINYLGPKSHDSQEDKDYLMKLELALEKLQEKVK